MEKITGAAKWPRWLVTLGLIWGQLFLIVSTISDPTPRNLTLLLSIQASGLYTLLLWIARRFWLPRLSGRPMRNAILLGSFNAAVVEMLFWVTQTIIGVEGVAAHTNPLLDLVLTMPWYIGMVSIFVRVQRQWCYPPAIVLLLGAIYETGADGVIGGQIIPMLIGQRVALLERWILLVLIAFWQFIPVYSSMVLPPAWVLETAGAAELHLRSGRWAGLKPLLWLLPYTVYLVGMLVVLSQ